MNLDEKVIAIVAVTVITVVGVVFLGDKDLVQYGILAVGSLAGSGGVASIVSAWLTSGGSILTSSGAVITPAQ